MKKIVFNQFFGIGDILFIEPIIRKFYQKGHEVILPVLPQFTNIQPYFPYITIVNKEEYNIDYECQKIIETDDSIIYPLRWSKEYFNSPLDDTMRNKYKMFDLPLDTWRELTWLRHRWKENKLIKELNVPDKYIVKVNKYHSYNKTSIDIKIQSDLPIIELMPIDNYTLLDWATILENATEIHSVNTATLFLFEILTLNTKEIHLYTRGGNKGRDFQQTEYLRTKNYILHD